MAGMTKNEDANLIRQELEKIAKAGGGVLKPDAVVAFARNKETALHSQFNWDNTAAARLWRLHQARNLIRVQVTFEPRVERTMQVYVSLAADREDEGGGYRRMVDVLSDEDRYEQLLQMAFAEFSVFQKKYVEITELSDVFAAYRTAQSSVKTKKIQSKTVVK